MIKGIDVSEHQGHIDFSKVKTTEQQFVIFRDGIGTRIDKCFLYNVADAKKNNFKIEALYHFSHATSVDDVKAEARNAVENAKKAGLSGLPIFFDYEYESNDCYKKKNGKPIDKETIRLFATTFCNVVKDAGYQYGIYSNTDYYKNFYGEWIPEGGLFWFADLYGDADFTCDYHQYSWKGKVDGISGDVDCNYKLRAEKPVESPKKTIEELANEVISGKWGNGDIRKKKLTDAGYDYSAVQKRVNELMAKTQKPEPLKKSVDELAKEVIAGKWGNGDDRKKALEAAGYNYREVQDKVNEILKPTTKAVSPAQSRDDSLAGTYSVTASYLNCRYIPGLTTAANVIQVLKKGDKVQCYGYYTSVNNSKWYLIQKGAIKGFVDSRYLTRV